MLPEVSVTSFTASLSDKVTRKVTTWCSCRLDDQRDAGSNVGTTAVEVRVPARPSLIVTGRCVVSSEAARDRKSMQWREHRSAANVGSGGLNRGPPDSGERALMSYRDLLIVAEYPRPTAFHGERLDLRAYGFLLMSLAREDKPWALATKDLRDG